MTLYSNADSALENISWLVLEQGDDVPARQGGTTKELLNQCFTLVYPLDRYILNPARKPSLAAQIIETAWVLSGRGDIETLLPYLPRAADFSDDGKTWRGAYGPRIRRWGGDQLARVIGLLNEDPMTRRAVISLYDPEIDMKHGKDIPCNNWLHFTKRGGFLNLSVAIRSNDVIWGWSGINQFEWSVLLEVVAHYTQSSPGSITYFVGSQHIYSHHFERARKIASSALRVTDRGTPAPAFNPGGHFEDFDRILDHFWRIERMILTQVTPSNVPVQVQTEVLNFPEPMLRSWLYVLVAYWAKEGALSPTLQGTVLALAWRASVNRKTQEIAGDRDPNKALFYKEVTELHARKSEAYGDSWRRRGEVFGIMANIARKVDRLGKTTDDETAVDTAIDLMNYLIKYDGWVRYDGKDFDEVADFNLVLSTLMDQHSRQELDPRVMEETLALQFSALEEHVVSRPDAGKRNTAIGYMTEFAYAYAYSLWEGQNREGAERAAAWKPPTS